VTIAMLRGGALKGRLAVELRHDQSLGGKSVYHATANGVPANGEAHLVFVDGQQDHPAGAGEINVFSALRKARFKIPATGASELKVWIHRITPELRSEGLAALLTLGSNGEQGEIDLESSGGQVILPYSSGNGEIEIALVEEKKDDRL